MCCNAQRVARHVAPCCVQVHAAQPPKPPACRAAGWAGGKAKAGGQDDLETAQSAGSGPWRQQVPPP